MAYHSTGHPCHFHDNFDSDLRHLGSVGGGPVADLSAEMNNKGLLQLNWSLPDNVEDVATGV